MKVETLKIKHGESYAIINVSDFNDSVHERFELPAIQVAGNLATQPSELLEIQNAEQPATQPSEPPPEPPKPQTLRRSLKRKP